MPTTCTHLEPFSHPRKHGVKPKSHGCEECLKSHSDWVHLRLCLTCGHVGCCDNSPHKHGTKHFHETKHPVMKSYEPGEDWAWCFVDELMQDGIPTFKEETADEHISSR